MKKIYILGVTSFAMFAFGVVSAGSAFAVETAQWLVDGASIALTEKVNVDLPKQLPSRPTTLQKTCIEKTFEANQSRAQ